MDSSIFTFLTDFVDEGVDEVLANISQRGGLGGVTIAAAYHEGRDIFPHNPVRKVHFLPDGATYMPVDWGGERLRPPASDLTSHFPKVVATAKRQDLTVDGWTVFLHNGALAREHPDCAPVNAFGDRYLTGLCPAHPDVRSYSVALSAAVAAQGVRTVIAESLHHHPLEHGYAHERYFVPLSSRARYLLGLCFCHFCLRDALGRGVDGQALRDDVRAELDAVFDDAAELPLADECGLAGYRRVRQDVVTSLARECAAAARQNGSRFEFLEPSGMIKGYATGRPEGGPSREIAWMLGVDVDAVAQDCDGIEAIGYAHDPARIRLDLQAYAGAAASIALRPGPPDCDSVENLRAKIRLARELGLRRADFYHYSLMRLSALDLIRAALHE